MKSSTRMRLAAVAAAGALALSACGGDDTADPTTDGTAAGTTSSSTTAADGGDATSEEPATEDSSEAAPGEEVPLEDFVAMLQSPGEETLQSYTMAMEMKSGGEGMTMSGAVDLSGDSPAMDLDMTVPGAGEMKMLMADGRMFMSMPGVTPEGKFMEVPKEQLGDAATALEDVDITSQFEDWKDTAQSVVFVGEEDVDGTMMRRYTVTMDTSSLDQAAATSGVDDAAVSSVLGEELTYDLWLDEDNLMRKMAFEIQGMVTEMTTDNWGEAQDVQAPADADLVDMGSLGQPTG